MKKGKKITLIVAGCLVLLGLILAGAGMAAIGFDCSRLSTVGYHTEYFDIAEPFQKVSISGESSDIHLYPSEYDTCKVVYTDNQDVSFSVAVENGTLEIHHQPGSTWHVQVGIYPGETGISVYLPQNQYESLELHTSGGNVTVSEGIRADSVRVESASGEIEIRTATVGELSAASQSGNIHIANASPEALQVDSGSGEIKLEHVKGGAAIQAKSVSGDMTLTDVSGETLTVHTASGEITLTRVVTEDQMCLQSTSGDLVLQDCDGATLSIQSGSGSVSGTLLSEKVFLVETASGDVDVPHSPSGGTCEVSTTSGDIDFTIAGRQ